MAGWQVYAPNWGCDSWGKWDDIYDLRDFLYFNLVTIDVDDPHYRTIPLFIRQPKDKGSVAARLRMQICANIIMRQWLQTLRDICARGACYRTFMHCQNVLKSHPDHIVRYP